MGRPKRVFPERVGDYKIKFTRKVKMIFEDSITAFHLLKETEKSYVSIDTWSAFCSKYQVKKKYYKPAFDLPEITDETTYKFLDRHGWKDWVADYYDREGSDIPELVELFKWLFPDKELIKFYELEHIVGKYCWGCFTGQPERGKKNLEYLNFNYYSKEHFSKDYPKKALKLYKKYHAEKDKDRRTKKYEEFREVMDKYIMKNHNLLEVFRTIGENAIILPYAFKNPTVEGFAYEHAGDILFVISGDKIYFEIIRHF